ncbi:hypothetical protein C3L21_35325 (plasmid) [Sinorhizobium meliloti]|nr:hypothetical protein C3L21_35325 [Sinorhizobium meliloti]
MLSSQAAISRSVRQMDAGDKQPLRRAGRGLAKQDHGAAKAFQGPVEAALLEHASDVVLVMD